MQTLYLAQIDIAEEFGENLPLRQTPNIFPHCLNLFLLPILINQINQRTPNHCTLYIFGDGGDMLWLGKAKTNGERDTCSLGMIADACDKAVEVGW